MEELPLHRLEYERPTVRPGLSDGGIAAVFFGGGVAAATVGAVIWGIVDATAAPWAGIAVLFSGIWIGMMSGALWMAMLVRRLMSKKVLISRRGLISFAAGAGGLIVLVSSFYISVEGANNAQWVAVVVYPAIVSLVVLRRGDREK
jgi:hypothetical protein